MGPPQTLTTSRLPHDLGRTCTTISWTFWRFYKKTLLDYERHKVLGGELNVLVASHPKPINIENQTVSKTSWNVLKNQRGKRFS
ncbi:hypothetical protein JHK85_012576 [Glycine max]|nr:hypothetical protein JHK85_012576 [Glycine max]